MKLIKKYFLLAPSSRSILANSVYEVQVKVRE